MTPTTPESLANRIVEVIQEENRLFGLIETDQDDNWRLIIETSVDQGRMPNFNHPIRSSVFHLWNIGRNVEMKRQLCEELLARGMQVGGQENLRLEWQYIVCVWENTQEVGVHSLLRE